MPGGSDESRCKTMMTNTMRMATVAAYMLGFFSAVIFCNFLNVFLRPLSQPRIISEFIVGVALSNIPFIRKSLNNEVHKTLNYIADVGMICQMFVVGLDMDPNMFLHFPVREAKVASAGVLTTFILAAVSIPYLHIPHIQPSKINLTLAVILSGTASPLLTRLITDLKISKSDIGRFVITTGILSDLFATLLVSLGAILFDPSKMFAPRAPNQAFLTTATLVIEIVFSAKATPILMNWVNQENPEGKPMKGPHLVLSVAYVVMVCSFSPVLVQYNKVLSAFLAGVLMPREGRIAKMMINKVKYFFTSIFYPLFFFWVGTEAELPKFQAGTLRAWENLICLFLISTVGKLLGTVVSGVMLGFRWPESIAIGLLLNIKGHFQIYLAIIAATVKITSFSDSIGMIFVTILTIIYTPLVVAKIIERARKRSPTQRMALQWLNPANELRILLCLHGPQGIQSAINFMEISRGPADPGIMVYFTDMIELTDKIAASLAHGGGEGVDAVTVTDRGVVEMREKISNAVRGYLEEDGEGISLRRMMALSTINSMHQDICILAEELSVSLIILPFHKDQETDGKLNGGHSGFRHVNRKMLRHAPCSVGILVDRGLGSTKLSRSSMPINVAVIFIGGKDDREALSYAGRVARHPGVKLTVIRFLLDANTENASSTLSKARLNTAEHQEEMKLDDEYFAEFYGRHVAAGHVAYMEKYLVNSGQTFSTLRSLEGEYALFIVGRGGGRVNSLLTAGMNDWEECPELGPIGDILSASDYSVTSSVLIIQQHSLRGELDGLHDEFSIM